MALGIGWLDPGKGGRRDAPPLKNLIDEALWTGQLAGAPRPAPRQTKPWPAGIVLGALPVGDMYLVIADGWW